MTVAVFSGIDLKSLTQGISNQISATQSTIPKLSALTTEPTSPNAAENPIGGSPSNIPIAASGNAAYAATAIQKSNANPEHVCSMPQGLSRALNMAGAMGGQIIQEIRLAISAALKALGISPATNGFTSKIKKLAQDIKDLTKIVKDITKWVNGLIVYVNAIKQIIQVILSLPAVLLNFFQDCLKQAYAQLRAGYLSVMSTVVSTPGGDSADSAIKAAGEVIQNTGELIKASAQLAAAPVALAAQALQPGLTPVSNTAAQAAATTQLFAAAGFSDSSRKLTMP